MKLANLFSENTILQRDRPVPIWGWSNPGETVTVEFAGQKKSTVAGSDGKWTVILDPMPASITPRDLVVSALRDSPAAIRNVLVGDLWLCSGQSNMWWPVSSSNHAEAEMASANFPQIRLFAVPNIVQAVAPADVDTTWQPCSPESVKAFSAVGYFFGREVWQTTGIPIGLINCSWGGSNIEPWISLEGLLTDPIAGPVAVQVDTQMATPAGQAAAAATPFDHELWIQQQGRPDPGNSGFAAGWAAPDLNDRPWSVMELPKSWQSEGFNFSGVFWFRREVAVPAACAGHDLELHLGHLRQDRYHLFQRGPGRRDWI